MRCACCCRQLAAPGVSARSCASDCRCALHWWHHPLGELAASLDSCFTCSAAHWPRMTLQCRLCSLAKVDEEIECALCSRLLHRSMAVRYLGNLIPSVGHSINSRIGDGSLIPCCAISASSQLFYVVTCTSQVIVGPAHFVFPTLVILFVARLLSQTAGRTSRLLSDTARRTWSICPLRASCCQCVRRWQHHPLGGLVASLEQLLHTICRY